MIGFEAELPARTRRSHGLAPPPPPQCSTGQDSSALSVDRKKTGRPAQVATLIRPMHPHGRPGRLRARYDRTEVQHRRRPPFLVRDVLSEPRDGSSNPVFALETCPRPTKPESRQPNQRNVQPF